MIMYEGITMIIILSILLVINVLCLYELFERRRTILYRYRRAVLSRTPVPV